MGRIALICTLVMVLAAPAFADLVYRLNPCSARDWDHGTQHTITIQVMSDSGPVTLFGVEVWVQYFEYGSGTYEGQLRLDGVNNLVPTSMLEASATHSEDDGEANYSQYNFPGGSGTGLVVDSDWVSIGELTYTVIGYKYRFAMDHSYLYAFNDASQPVAGTGPNCPTGWIGHMGEFFAAPTGVELVSFTASALRKAVVLEWTTASEPDNAGFNLWRSDKADGGYIKINDDLIPGRGDATHGADYEFEDSDVDRGRTYYYKLEDINIHGASLFHGPVEATVPGLVLCGAVSDSGAAGLALLALVAGMVLAVRRAAGRKRPYRKPWIRTTSGEQMLKKLGPAQTCSPTPAQCPTAD